MSKTKTKTKNKTFAMHTGPERRAETQSVCLAPSIQICVTSLVRLMSELPGAKQGTGASTRRSPPEQTGHERLQMFKGDRKVRAV